MEISCIPIRIEPFDPGFMNPLAPDFARLHQTLRLKNSAGLMERRGGFVTAPADYLLPLLTASPIACTQHSARMLSLS
jgi:hypothetical protein